MFSLRLLALLSATLIGAVANTTTIPDPMEILKSGVDPFDPKLIGEAPDDEVRTDRCYTDRDPIPDGEPTTPNEQGILWCHEHCAESPGANWFDTCIQFPSLPDGVDPAPGTGTPSCCICTGNSRRNYGLHAQLIISVCGGWALMPPDKRSCGTEQDANCKACDGLSRSIGCLELARTTCGTQACRNSIDKVIEKQKKTREEQCALCRTP